MYAENIVLTIHIMKKTFLVILLCVITGIGVFAQTRPNKALYLNTAFSFGLTNAYDNGAVPFYINGVSTMRSFGASYEWKRYETHFDFRKISTTLFDPNGTCTTFDLDYDFLYRIHDSENGRWHQWIGGDIYTLADIRQIPSLQNASTNLSFFSNLGFTWKAEYDFAYNKEKTHHWLTAYNKVNLPLVGLAYRPDYSYVCDAIGMTETFGVLFANHHTFAKCLPGCNTELGLRLNFKNGNRIAFNYRWDFVTTGHKDYYSYVNALHSFNITLLFNLYRK